MDNFSRGGSSGRYRRVGDWLRFEADGTVSVFSGKVELGQGIATALAQIVAEELDMPIERVHMVAANTAESPNEGVTSGSLSIQDSGSALRRACARARALRAEGVETLDALHAHEITGDAPLKPVTSYRVVGTSAPRVDIPRKVTGQPSFLQDIVLPGMLFGRVVRPPSYGATLDTCDDRRADALAGVVRIVRDGSFLGVIAEREDIAIKAAKLLHDGCKWRAGPALPDASSIHAYLEANEASTSTLAERTDPGASARGVRSFEASYSKPYLSHASIGPSCALARGGSDRMHVWSHSQGLFNLRRDLVMVLGLPEEQVIVQHAEGAGCYGHNGADDVALDAALLARAAHGRPVQVQWTRDDEFAWEPYGPAMRMKLAATVDAAGTIVDWRHDVWSNGHSMRPGRADTCGLIAAWHLAQPFAPPPAINAPLPQGGAERNAIPLYEFANQRIVNHFVAEVPLRVSSLRSLGGYANVFAIESFMDEIAESLDTDPVVFRLRHLNDPRAVAVIEAAAQHAGWTEWRSTEGRGHGIGFARYKNLGAYCAVIAEVEAEREVRVCRLVVAVDVGLVINPDGVKNQIEGGAVQATSWTLKEQVRFDQGRITSCTWESYPILKFSEVPKVEVVLIDRPDAPALGAGEAAQGPTGAAIANALADALDVRVRNLPLSAENIVAAML